MLSGCANTNISKFLNYYKSISSRLIKERVSLVLKKQLWKEYFLSRSYCLVTTCGIPIEVVRNKIKIAVNILKKYIYL
ncbi:transposase [Clostridium sp.]|uniref:transposase n=1 Tax=Clostridium sp. TaxID=1506 RepID=UPI002588AC5C|nr:transposase [Clostridium sp.]